MATVLFILALSSGYYEMLFLMIGFREYVTWRLAVVWVAMIATSQVLS
ncbi:hypothetical protein [Lactiplantibacillus paraplantarum]|nr:hypothetical protein [Lactiplantibacillus paraplantarum]